MDKSTIAAIATPIGSGGIGIIRISGTAAISIAYSIFRRFDSSVDHETKSQHHFSRHLSRLLNHESHRFYYGCIIEPEQDKIPEKNKIIDEVLVVFMESPRTYTRENVVEIHAHSGPAVLRSILNIVVQQGARLANPGEFTYRAFLNGRIDLTQAEGVIDIINARTDRAHQAAAAQLMGGIKIKIESIINSLLSILTETEAAIDFPDEIGDEIKPDRVLEILINSGIEPLQIMIQEYEQAHIIRDGLKIVIAGRPNVGKSSLMNRLLKKERSIVTSIPGTTRDLIEDSLTIMGIPIVLTDTAGLHNTNEPVEKIGIERAYTHIENADLLLFMTDAGCPITKDDLNIYKVISHKPIIRVMNKSDLIYDDIHLNPDSWSDSWPESWNELPCIKISALHNLEIDSLKDMIAQIAIKDSIEYESSVIPNIRHKQAIGKSLKALVAAKQGIDMEMPFELINIDIQEAIDHLGDVIGKTIREDILDHIFSNFCIGK